MITKYITKYSSNCKVCIVLGIPMFVFSNVCMQIKLVNILTYVQILSYKNGMRFNMKGNLAKVPHGNIVETCAVQQMHDNEWRIRTIYIYIYMLTWCRL